METARVPPSTPTVKVEGAPSIASIACSCVCSGGRRARADQSMSASGFEASVALLDGALVDRRED
eukprot:2991101-Prymnesium_polylepis.1